MTEMKAMRILLIEDRPENVRAIESGFREAGLQPAVQWAQSYLAAQQLLEEYADGNTRLLPHLVVLNFHIADGAGRELLRMIRTTPALARLPVLVMADGEARDKAWIEAVAHGADFVEHPAEPLRWLPLIRRFTPHADAEA